MNNSPISELAWILANYQARGIEPPPRIRDNPSLTEGEMMSADEIAEFIQDSVATLRILHDKGSERYPQILAQYQADLDYLVKVGSLAEDDYMDLVDEATLRF